MRIITVGATALFALVFLGSGVSRAADPFDEGMALYDARMFVDAAEALRQVPGDHPRFADAMRIVGYNIYVHQLKQPKKGFPFLQKALAARSWDRAVVEDYARGCLAAGKKLVTRKRSKKLEPKYEFLTQAVSPGGRWAEQKIAKQKLLDDLDILEFTLEHCYSYLELNEVDYRNALDTIRASLEERHRRDSFALSIARFLALFGDGHTRLIANPNRYMPPGETPFLAAGHGERVFLFLEDRTDFVDAEHPYVVQLDGQPVERWLAAAATLAPRGSPQFQRRQSLRNLRYVAFLRAVLGLPHAEQITLDLVSADGQKKKQVQLPVSDKHPVFGQWPRHQTRRLDGDIGYLRIPRMSGEDEFLAELRRFMQEFRDTKGLVIDVRGNSGGSRHALRTLLPYFLEPEGGMRIVNVGARRLTPTAVNKEGYLERRFLYPPSSKTWKEEDAKVVKSFLNGFAPEWKLSKGKFSDWHAMGIKPGEGDGTYHYQSPVIILMNEDCFSATDIFLGAFKGLAGVTLIGTPSSGGSGYADRHRLPHSRIEYRASRMASFRPNGQLYERRGVEPDVRVESIPTDTLGKTDSVLRAAIRRLTGS